MAISIGYAPEKKRYGVKDGLIYYVSLSKPSTISNTSNPWEKPDGTPYTVHRTLFYGVFTEDGCGYKAQTLHQTKYATRQRLALVHDHFDEWCERYGCTLSWEDATKLAGWS